MTLQELHIEIAKRFPQIETRVSHVFDNRYPDGYFAANVGGQFFSAEHPKGPEDILPLLPSPSQLLQNEIAELESKLAKLKGESAP